ncbi:TPA: hypothetical protein DCX15_00930 [bacterium]|nr:hypothetical protein [bacterium]
MEDVREILTKEYRLKPTLLEEVEGLKRVLKAVLKDTQTQVTTYTKFLEILEEKEDNRRLSKL